MNYEFIKVCCPPCIVSSVKAKKSLCSSPFLWLSGWMGDACWCYGGRVIPSVITGFVTSPFCVLRIQKSISYILLLSVGSRSMGENDTSTDNYKTVWQVPWWEQAQGVTGVLRRDI